MLSFYARLRIGSYVALILSSATAALPAPLCSGTLVELVSMQDEIRATIEAVNVTIGRMEKPERIRVHLASRGDTASSDPFHTEITTLYLYSNLNR
jgi:hypothetical protein